MLFGAPRALSWRGAQLQPRVSLRQCWASLSTAPRACFRGFVALSPARALWREAVSGDTTLACAFSAFWLARDCVGGSCPFFRGSCPLAPLPFAFSRGGDLTLSTSPAWALDARFPRCQAVCIALRRSARLFLPWR